SRIRWMASPRPIPRRRRPIRINRSERRTIMRTLFVALAGIVIGCTGLAIAQTPTATLVGRVTDTSHGSVASATVKVRNVDTNDLRTIETQADGEYTVANLEPGFYDVTVAKEGFKQVRDRRLELQVGQAARLDITLEVGTVTQTVEVSATLPVLNTESFTRGDVIAPNEITEMP